MAPVKDSDILKALIYSEYDRYADSLATKNFINQVKGQDEIKPLVFSEWLDKRVAQANKALE